ncbi:MAG: preprotein translocase subunit SecA [Rickettsiales bacterium]|nr:preprotein translocase subunit SecA [Rickettsiales bacterium]
MLGLVKSIFKSNNHKQIQKFQRIINQINELERNYVTLNDEGLKAQTDILRSRLKAGESLNDILPNAFAVVREAAKRVIGQRHFDVQMIGGIVLHRGEIAEMRTGEGKTLVATLPSYLNALEGKGVHIVTVNDYLAKFQSEWMAEIHRFLGLSVGCILHEMDDEQRKAAYNCDITYGTNSEFGFDYLRDNMKYSIEAMSQRPFNFAIVDEVDSILIDEARTPLIISGPTDDSSDLYIKVDNIIKKIDTKLCTIDEKDRQVAFNEEGNEWVEKEFKKAGLIEQNDGLYDVKNMDLIHHASQALKAHKLFKNEVDYIVKDGQVYIVDEFTGRIMEGRRFSDGLHQALEAKEGVEIQNENQTLASITYQNYFRMYPKLAGMTGTAMTEASEFEFIYGLKTIEIPTNKSVKRRDEEDCIFKNTKGKFKAIADQVEDCYKRKQPVLIGTVSIEKSELISNLLKARKIPHDVLNAKQHEREAKIVAQAGIPGNITIATNMAGRGTDIMLGGNPDFLIKDVCTQIENEEEKKKLEQEIKETCEKDKKIALEAGGLYILGTERHESRRIDNQLRGRSGRQGDPGDSKFFLSLEDDLLRIFGSDKLGGMLGKLGLDEDEAIIHPWISKSVEKAQKKVENAHYEMRKNVLKYDDVVNEQRLIIFEQRKDIINANDMSEEIDYLREEKNNEILNRYVPEKSYVENWDLEGLQKEIERIYNNNFDFKKYIENNVVGRRDLIEKINEYTKELYHKKEELYGEGLLRQVEKRIFLMTVDKYWKDHLYNLDKLRQGINFRAYAQKDPLLEYKKEAFQLFEELMYNMNEEYLIRIFHVVINIEALNNNQNFLNAKAKVPSRDIEENRTELLQAMRKKTSDNENLMKQPTVRSKVNPNQRNSQDPSTWGKVMRNDPCPCGSGKKYKQCCGKLS